MLEPGVDGRLELRVALAHGHPVGLFRVEVADHLPVARIRRLGLQTGELDAVVRIRVDLPLRQRLEGGRLVRKLAQLRLRVLLADDLGVGRALLGRDALAGDVVDALDGAALLHQELRARVEKREAEVHRLAALGRVGHGLGDQIDRVVGQQRDAGRRRRFLFLDLDRLADGLRDLGLHQHLDQVDGEADPLVVLVDVREGRRARPCPDRQDTGLLDLREGVLLGPDRRDRREGEGQGDNHTK